MHSFAIAARGDVDLRGALVVVGAPGVGLVGAIASQYVVSRLGLPLVGGLYSPALQPDARIHGGVSQPPFRIHAGPSLAVVTTEATPPAEHMPAIASCIARWAATAGCARVVTPDGVVIDREELDDTIWGAASDDEGVAFLRAHGVPIVQSGRLGGFSGAMMNACAVERVPGLSLLAETAPGYPDARAAARLVDVMDAMLPQVVIGTQPLVEEAAAVEEALREAQARLAARRG